MSATENADIPTHQPSLSGPVGSVTAVAVLAVFAVIDPLVGVVGAALVGACWVVFGPVTAFAVGQFVGVVLASGSLVAPLVVQASLAPLLLGVLPAGVAPARHLAAGGAAFVALGAVTGAAWLWTGAAPVAATVALLSLTAGLYAVYRYETVILGAPSTPTDRTGLR